MTKPLSISDEDLKKKTVIINLWPSPEVTFFIGLFALLIVCVVAPR